LKTEGRPAFNPKVFLKLYFYGYLNGLRSSRKLEKEPIRNADAVERNGLNYSANKDLYRLRQELERSGTHAVK